MKKISWPNYSKDEIKIVKSILVSGKVNQWTGTYVKKFENSFSKLLKLNYCAAVSNGTAALEAALFVLNLKKNDEIIVTPRSFVASASAVLKMNLIPRFADVDLNSQNIELNQIKRVFSKKTKAIICVHLAGYPSNMFKIKNFAKKYNIKIIEDCSQAHGAKINNRYMGSFGDISIWSFCQDKIISTLGEGGMIGTNNKLLYSKILSYRDHGKNINKLNKIKNLNEFNYIHDFIGTNIRITEIQAAVGYLQLKKLNLWVKKRNKITALIDSELSKIEKGVIIQKIPKNYTHSFYRYYFFVNIAILKDQFDINLIIKELRKRSNLFFIGGSPEIYKEKVFSKYCKNMKLKNANELSKKSICIKISHNLSKSDIIKLCNIVKRTFKDKFQ